MYTLGTAAKATGKGKTTILKAIKSGRISAKKDDIGQWEIDPSELHRVYKPVSVNSSSVPQSEHQDTPSEPLTFARENEVLRERLADKDDVISDLRKRLDEAESQRTKLTNMLMEPRRKSFWHWLTRSG